MGTAVPNFPIIATVKIFLVFSKQDFVYNKYQVLYQTIYFLTNLSTVTVDEPCVINSTDHKSIFSIWQQWP